MRKTRDLFKKIGDTKVTFHAKMSTIKERKGKDLREAKRIRRGSKNTQKNCTQKKDLKDLDNHNGVVPHLEANTLEYEVKWDLESITMNKASQSDGIPAELFKILKDDAVKCHIQYVCKFGKLSNGYRTGKSQISFQSQERQCKECSNCHRIVLTAHAYKVML